MPYYKFEKNDLFNNVIKTYPSSEFAIYNGKVFYNNKPQLSGAFTASIPCVPPGNLSLYELNVDRNKDAHLFVPYTDENVDLGTVSPPKINNAQDPRPGNTSVIFPFIIKTSDGNKLKHITDTEFNTKYSTGQWITGSYPLSASIKRDYYADQHARVVSFYEVTKKGQPPYQVVAPDRPGLKDPDTKIETDSFGKQIWTTGLTGHFAEIGNLSDVYVPRPSIMALKNTLNYYTKLSKHFAFSSSEEGWRKDLQELNLISIPSMYYGSSIKRGSVDLKFFVKGKLVGRARDLKKNGELLDTSMINFSNKSILFDGGTNYQKINKNTAFNQSLKTDGVRIAADDSLAGFDNFTISMWINQTGPGINKKKTGFDWTLFNWNDKHRLYLKIDHYAPGTRIWFQQNRVWPADPTKPPQFFLAEDNADNILEGRWYHIIISHDGSDKINVPLVYVNGQPIDMKIHTTPDPNTHAPLIATSGRSTIGYGPPWDQARAFEGYIDEVSIWNDNLNASEVSAIYNGGKACNLVNHSKYGNLVSWWRMGENVESEKNTQGGIFPTGIHDAMNANYKIVDENGSNNGYMVGIADYKKYFSSGEIEDELSKNVSELKYDKTGISSIAAPSCLTGSYMKTDGNDLVAGVVLYNEGFIMLTGSWNLDTNWTSDYLDDGTSKTPKWIYFGSRLPSGSGDAQSDRDHALSLEPRSMDAGANPNFKGNSLDTAFFNLSFEGINHVPTKTMLVHAPKGRLNHSNNPTYVQFGSDQYESTGSLGYFESGKIPIKNIVSSSHKHYSASFAKQTFISKVGIYDENKNLIAIAKLATPVRKREIDNLTFKLKLDI